MKTIELIQRTIADYFDITANNLKFKCRKREIVKPRQISMYFTKKHTSLTLSQIGRLTGEKDHSTVIHSLKCVNNSLDTDRKFKKEIEEIENLIKIACNIKTKDDYISELKAIISKQRAIIKKMQKNKRKHLKIVA